ncbi:MAG: flagellar motor switch protein FliN [Gemmatimonadetes bacterium]|nr:flagellar motor switch protein FliN [Gemmatimonadota bacterium]
MAEEENTDDLADEMMAEEAGDAGDTADSGDTADEGGEDDFEAQMLQTMQAEMGGGDDAPAEDGGGGGDLESQMIQAMATETGSTAGHAAAAIEHVGGIPEGASPNNIRRVLDVRLSVSIELGQTYEPVSTLLQWTEGSLIELEKVSGEPVDVIVNNKPYARGEVVVIAENFGVRLTEISPKPARSAMDS